ncbi:MAG: glutamyl-tRNA reductase [Rubrivivax sp.]
MSLLALSLNHHSAPLDLRARFAFAPAQLPEALQSLRARLQRAAPEVTLLSTCNRTELYVAPSGPVTPADAVAPALEWLAERGGASRGDVDAHVRVAQGEEVARHAFRVSAGLESMVLGEPQILGQMKLAVREAGLAGTLGSTLHQLFQRSFAVAKEVRSATEIGAHSVSMAAAAARLSLQLFGSLEQARVLFVGAGEMIELCAAHFASRKPRSMTVANRTAERGEALARRFGASPMALSELPERLHDFDVVVTCTASSLPIIGLGAMERALKARRRRPMFVVDLAVPRDVEPEVARLPDVYLYTVDDLSELVQKAGERRQAEVVRAEAIVEEGVRSFSQWLHQRDTVPLIRAIHEQADTWREHELARARRLLARGDDPAQVMDALARGLVAKLMHGAMAELRGGDGAQREAVAHTVARCFLPQQRH